MKKTLFYSYTYGYFVTASQAQTALGAPSIVFPPFAGASLKGMAG